MQMERKALYNLMRMNWLLDPSLGAEPWQVEDYRALSLSELFARLSAHDIDFDKKIFIALTDEAAGPEELTEMLLADTEADLVARDQVYLLVFELWRRLIPERPSLSLFCDELDQQIYLYDHQPEEHAESVQDAVANLQVLLDENADNGEIPHEMFQSLCSHTANDLESFIYDYICDQIDSGQEAYVNELLDGFIEYVSDAKWFHLLRIRLVSLSDPSAIYDMIRELYAYAAADKDVNFNLELLSLLTAAGDQFLFTLLLKDCAPLLNNEEQFQDLLTICKDFCQQHSLPQQEATLDGLLEKRAERSPEEVFNSADPHLDEVLALFP